MRDEGRGITMVTYRGHEHLIRAPFDSIDSRLLVLEVISSLKLKL